MNQVLLVGRYVESDARSIIISVNNSDPNITPLNVRIFMPDSLLERVKEFNIEYNDIISVKGTLDSDGYGSNCVRAQKIAFLGKKDDYMKGGEISNGQV